jgi:hypothetical protein
MAYLGGWCNAVESLRPGKPGAFFDALFDPDDEARRWSYEGSESGSLSLYVYRCPRCGRCRANWDCS